MNNLTEKLTISLERFGKLLSTLCTISLSAYFLIVTIHDIIVMVPQLFS